MRRRRRSLVCCRGEPDPVLSATDGACDPRHWSISLAKGCGLLCALLAAGCAAAACEPGQEPNQEPARESPQVTAATPPQAKIPAPTVAGPAALPPLDLKSLENRLRETNAIGFFTKLTVKNQIDDLLDRFRDYYQGRQQTSLADLRQDYELLVLKVLALLQDADPPLATALAASRESIWCVLSSPEKFRAI